MLKRHMTKTNSFAYSYNCIHQVFQNPNSMALFIWSYNLCVMASL
jgi:hypothetical protein